VGRCAIKDKEYTVRCSFNQMQVVRCQWLSSVLVDSSVSPMLDFGHETFNRRSYRRRYCYLASLGYGAAIL
jgi:hypothetical protein